MPIVEVPTVVARKKWTPKVAAGVTAPERPIAEAVDSVQAEVSSVPDVTENCARGSVRKKWEPKKSVKPLDPER